MDRILKFYDLSASTFADKIGVQRSSISHLLSGRNKPSLEFVMKVTASFPEVDLHWLIYGKGSFPHKPKNPTPPQTQITKPNLAEADKNPLSSSKEIDKIIIFYSDGSFKAYTEK
ncbi:helix-turn-helix transcriptional regulator [Arenibacter sp. H213]